MRWPLATCMLLFICLPLQVQAAEPGNAALQPLLQVIHARLVLADQVALSKWDSGKAVQDPAREQQVITGAMAQGQPLNLDPGSVERLLRAQIEASKQVQTARLAQWRLAGQAPDTPRQDLAQVIRPQLDDLQTRLLHTYADFQPFKADAACKRWLSAGLAAFAGDPVHDQALVLATAGLCTNAP